LGLLARAGEKRSWNCVVLAAVFEDSKCSDIMEDLRIGELILAFRRTSSLQTLEQL
jgi:hypothetical protein